MTYRNWLEGGGDTHISNNTKKKKLLTFSFSLWCWRAFFSGVRHVASLLPSSLASVIGHSWGIGRVCVLGRRPPKTHPIDADRPPVPSAPAVAFYTLSLFPTPTTSTSTVHFWRTHFSLPLALLCRPTVRLLCAARWGRENENAIYWERRGSRRELFQLEPDARTARKRIEHTAAIHHWKEEEEEERIAYFLRWSNQSRTFAKDPEDFDCRSASPFFFSITIFEDKKKKKKPCRRRTWLHSESSDKTRKFTSLGNKCVSAKKDEIVLLCRPAYYAAAAANDTHWASPARHRPSICKQGIKPIYKRRKNRFGKLPWRR